MGPQYSAFIAKLTVKSFTITIKSIGANAGFISMGNTTNVRILKSYASDPLIFLLPYTICDDSNFAEQNNKTQYIAQPPIFHFSVFIDNISCCHVKQVVFRPLQVPLIRARGWHKHMICFMASPYIKFVRCEDNMFKKVFKDINYPGEVNTLPYTKVFWE